MNIKEHIATEKAESVIIKCVNCIQLKYAFKYIDLLYNKFGNSCIYGKLYKLCVKKEIELDCTHTLTD